MVEAFRCSQCSAPVTDDRWTNCPYCGTVLAKPTINPLRAAVAPERFAAVERSPGFAELMRREPSGAGTLAGKGVQTVFLLLWTVGCGVGTVLFLPVGALALMPAAMCIVGIVLVVRQSADTARFAGSELERRVAVWKDERTEVRGGGENSSATTYHFALLEERSGRRKEYSCSAQLAGANAPGDIGVAYVRAGVLLDFQRVDV